MGTDGQTEITKLIIDFRNFFNPPKKQLYRPTSWESNLSTADDSAATNAEAFYTYM